MTALTIAGFVANMLAIGVMVAWAKCHLVIRRTTGRA